MLFNCSEARWSPVQLPSYLSGIWLRGIISAFLVVFVASCGTLSRIELDQGDGNAQRFAQSGDLKFEVDDLAQPLIRRKESTGVVVGVLTSDGRKHFYGYGLTKRIDGHEPDGSTLFAVGSISKGFLAATTSILVQEGSLKWEETLETLLPPNVPLSEDAKKITLRQLVTHTSGLPRQPFTVQTLAYFVEYLFTGNSFYRHFEREYLLKYMESFKAKGTTTPQYSNIGYGLLGYIIESRSKEKLDALVRRKLLDPLRLKYTGYDPEKLPGFSSRARGHSGDQPKFIRRGEQVPDWKFTDVMSGSAALYSSAHDLLQYSSSHLYASEDHLRDVALRETLKVFVERDSEAAASAWIVDNIEGRKITYQIGIVAGYTAYVGMDIENRTAVVVLQNSFNWTNRIGHRLLLRMAKAREKAPGALRKTREALIYSVFSSKK